MATSSPPYLWSGGGELDLESDGRLVDRASRLLIYVCKATTYYFLFSVLCLALNRPLRAGSPTVAQLLPVVPHDAVIYSLLIFRFLLGFVGDDTYFRTRRNFCTRACGRHDDGRPMRSEGSVSCQHISGHYAASNFLPSGRVVLISLIRGLQEYARARFMYSESSGMEEDSEVSKSCISVYQWMIGVQ